MMLKLKFPLAVILAMVVAACGSDPEDTGVEFAPAMYHTIPYEPYTQVADRENEYDNTIPDGISNKGSNLLKPVKGTVPRSLDHNDVVHKDIKDEILEYDLDPLDPSYAAENLKNPLPNTDILVDEGKALFNRFCSHCHGAKGKGDGPVAEMYPGVPKQYKASLTEGQIFHIITYGQGRMWPHGTQITPRDRWRIVRYVQTLQE